MSRILLLALACLLALAAPASAQGPDMDSDGVPDLRDACLHEPGSAQRQGCPEVVGIGSGDEDGDGAQDLHDLCLGSAGAYQGCPPPPMPDADGDGWIDTRDGCRTVPGQNYGCPVRATPTPSPVTPVQRPVATSVRPGGVQIDRVTRPAAKRLKALSVSGTPFLAGPITSYMTPKRLTIWLPKGITVSSAPLAPCSKSFARTMTLDTNERCTFMVGGRVSDERLSGWEAFAGPKQGARQRLWLRGVSPETEAHEGFGTGWIEPASGKRTKITLELGMLGFSTRGLEVQMTPGSTPRGYSAPLRGTCHGGIRMQLETAQGTAAKSFRC